MRKYLYVKNKSGVLFLSEQVPRYLYLMRTSFHFHQELYMQTIQPYLTLNPLNPSKWRDLNRDRRQFS